MDSWGALSVEFAASAVSARDEGSTKRPKTVLDAPVCFLVTVVCLHSCVVVLIRQDKNTLSLQVLGSLTLCCGDVDSLDGTIVHSAALVIRDDQVHNTSHPTAKLC